MSGNICPIPSAEARDKLVRMRDWISGSRSILPVSSGIFGKKPIRVCCHAARRGYKLDSVSRPVCTEDFFDFPT